MAGVVEEADGVLEGRGELEGNTSMTTFEMISDEILLSYSLMSHFATN